MSYASKTKVPIDRTRSEIERLVTHRGASQFFSASDLEKATAVIGWTIDARMVRLTVPMPERRNRQSEQALMQAWRARWRAVLLVVQAKFEAIDAGISTFEREFLADTVMADGTTVGDWASPQLESMYASGKMPKLLGMGPS